MQWLAEQIYALSKVLDHKLRVYRAAQLVTMISAGLWVAAIIAPQLPT